MQLAAVTMMTSHGNLLFCLDAQTSYMTIYEKSQSGELKTVNSLKFSVPNIRGIAANAQYVAVAYSGLKKEQLKGSLKTMSPSGVLLYRREQHVVCSVYEKQVVLSKSDCFKTLNAIALTDSYLFVCEKETSNVYKFEVKSGSIINTAQLDGEPFSVSANQTHCCVLDSANSNLYIFENETLESVAATSVKDIDQLAGQMSVVLSDENLVFVKNSANQIALLNDKLEYQAYFNEIQAKLINITLVRDNLNQMLVIACQNSKQQCKLAGYIA